MPVSVRVLAPALVRLPAPEITPERAASALFAIVALEASATALSMVVTPVIARLPPLNVSVPAERLPSAAIDRVPASILIVPEAVFVPLSVSMPLPVFTRVFVPSSVTAPLMATL